MKKLYLFITLLSTSCFFAQTNYLVDNFDYVAGTFLTDNGWNIHSGTTTNPVAVNTGGLSWNTYIGSDVGNAALVNNDGQDLNKPLAADITEGTVYASFLFKPSAAITTVELDTYFFHFGKYATPNTSLNSAFRARTFILQGTDPATQFKLGLAFNSTNYISPSGVTADLDITKTYLVVVKYTFVAGLLNDSVSMYVFTEGDDISTEPTTPTLGPFTGTAADLDIIQCVALRQSSLGQNAIVDGIYVRKVWDLTNPGTALGVDKFSQNNTLKVYPNPVQNNRVSIFSSIEGEKEVSLFDLNGRVVLKKTMTNNELELTNVNKGVYMLQTKVGSSTSTTKLIVN